MIHLASAWSAAETLSRLEALVRARGITVHARVSHSGDAEKAGLNMRPAELLIFGNPKGGTPAMVAAPTLALDLPLKALAWEDAEGRVWLSFNSPEYLAQRHKAPIETMTAISSARILLEEAAGSADL
jgi:uncharacterized protein (DUF302 family)